MLKPLKLKKKNFFDIIFFNILFLLCHYNYKSIRAYAEMKISKKKLIDYSQQGYIILDNVFSGRLSQKSGKNTSYFSKYSIVLLYHNVKCKKFIPPKCSFFYRVKYPKEYFGSFQERL